MEQELNLNCFDCNKSLQDCACMEDTIDMKQETLEEVALRLYPEEWNWREKRIFKEGAKWQAERMYSEEDIKNAFLEGWELRDGELTFRKAKNKWFKQFKKNS
jgi:hypothetical protein